jgi:carbon storage regulator
MLCLTRKGGEKVIIGKDIEVMILRIGPNSVRLGITAPGLNIARSELIDLLPHIDDSTLDCGSLGNINPTHTTDAIRSAIAVDDDCEPDPKYMTPMQKVDYYSHGIDNPKNHHHED